MNHEEDEIHRQTLTQLRIAADGAEAQIIEFLNYLKGRTQDFSSDGYIRDATEIINQKSGSYEQTVRSLNLHLAINKQPIIPECVETFIMDLSGRIIASSDSSHVGTDHSRKEYFLKGLESTYVSDVFREPETGRVTWITSTPLTGKLSGELIGVLANRIDPEALSDITTGRKHLALGSSTQSMRVGKTGETYIVNRNKLMITESRFLEDVILKQMVDTQPVRLALEQGEEMLGDYPDYRGVPISGASMILNELGWVILTEIDFSEAFIPIKKMQTNALTFAGIILIGIILTSLFLAIRFVKPIHRIIKADRALANGDQSASFIPDREIPKNEIGEVMRGRNEALIRLQHQTEETLSKLSGVVEQTADSVVITDKEGIIEYVNSAFEKITGYKKEEAIGRTPVILKSDKHDERFYEEMWKTILSGRAYQNMLINRKKNGELYYEEKTITPIKDRRGNITHFVATGKDITERRRAEEELKRRHKVFQSLYESAITWSGSLVDRCDQIVTKLSQVLKVSHATIERLEGSRIKVISMMADGQLIHGGEMPLSGSPCERVRHEKAICTFRGSLKEMFPKDVFFHEYNLNTYLGIPVKDSIGEVIGILHVMDRHERTFVEDEVHLLEIFARNISQEIERNTVEAQLLQAQKLEAVGKLAGGMAHDFNNLLTVILGNAEIGMMNLEPSNPMYRHFEEIKKTSHRAAALTRQILAFSRRQVLQPQLMDLNELIAEFSKMLHRLIGEHIELKFTTEEKSLLVFVDPNALEQVLLNLAVNARDAM
ncbi:MAG: PAS domain S-box protein, partial [Fidelibacterota bacterium]